MDNQHNKPTVKLGLLTPSSKLSNINNTSFFLKVLFKCTKSPTLGMQFLRIRQGQFFDFHALILLLKFSRECVYLIFKGTKLHINTVLEIQFRSVSYTVVARICKNSEQNEPFWQRCSRRKQQIASFKVNRTF